MSKPKAFNWSIIFIWLSLTLMGLVAIYSATQGPVSEFLPSFIKKNFYKQLGFVIVAIIVLGVTQSISPRTIMQFTFLFYLFCIVLMILTLLFGKEINGAKSWFEIGFFGIQSSELMKISTILLVANYLTSRRNISAQNIKDALVSVLIILIPTSLVIAQNDLGTAIIFLALIPVMLFWSGLPYGVSLFIVSPAIILYLTVINWQLGTISVLILTLGIFLVQRKTWLTVASFFTGFANVIIVQVSLAKLLQPHQVSRIIAFTNPSYDPTGAGWNVIQAKTAIGSGGVTGKGFLEGTQIQLKFLPESFTDFIFCVIGEEFGFIGTSTIIILFLLLFIKLLGIAANHKHPFAQLVTVSITSVYFIHFFINVGSATALLPVIGIPLPFISYGGSAFLSNTLMLAIILNMDFHKREFSIYR